MSKFLEQVAEFYLGATADHRRTTLVFPNKRSAMFMRRYLKRAASGPAFMPSMTTLGAYMGKMRGMREASRLEQLFTLYDAYVMTLNNRGKEAPPFDRFRFWGEMLLDDFDDIDRQMVDTEGIFQNISALHDISTDYLTDSQRAVAAELWGYDPVERYERFWKNAVRINDDGSQDRVYDGFVTLFDILSDVYKEFYHRLHARSMTTRGETARWFAENIDRLIDSGAINGRFGFVGFDILSRSERTVFARMRNLELADFFWDVPVVFKRDLPSNSRGKTSIPLERYIRNILKEFPMPESFGPETVSKAPGVEIVGVPSNTMQTKVAANILDTLAENGEINDRRADNTVVVLPDASILIPMLHSLPESLGSVNITMGLPVRHTPFATLMSLIINAQTNGRTDGDEYCYLTDNVVQIINHPSMTLIGAHDCAKLRHELKKRPRFFTPLSFIKTVAPSLAFMFRPVTGTETDNATGAGQYLTKLIDGIKSAIMSNVSPRSDAADKYEIAILDAYREAVDTIVGMIDSHRALTIGLDTGRMTFFNLVRRLLRNMNLNLSGSPLHGVQIMGVLETRSLDFDNVIALTMNEKTFPPRNYVRSMIPGALRAAYGMTTVEDREMQFGWIFYNLVGRSKRTYFMYDSTSENDGRGGKSRYLFQLENIFTGNPVKVTSLTTTGHLDRGTTIRISKKDKAVSRELSRFLSGGDMNLSASALKNYMKCPLKFYLSNVRKIAEAKKAVEYIEPATQGTIAHRTLEEIYNLNVAVCPGSVMSPRLDIQRHVIDTLLARKMDHFLYFDRYDGNVALMPGEARMLHRELSKNIFRIIELEKQRAPYVYIGAEVGPASDGYHDKSFDWKIDDSLSIRFTYSIDRVDRLDADTLRFVDYKSGSDKLEFKSVDALFHNGVDNPNDAVFQLLTYAHAYNDFQASIGQKSDWHIRPEIIKVFKPAGSVNVPLKIQGKCGAELLDHTDDAFAGFRPRLNQLIKEIFDEDVDFTQTEDIEDCRFCQFLNICHRVVPEKNW